MFQFGLGENANYVILELYAQGNILLTDSNFVVMTLLRSHRSLLSSVLRSNSNLVPTYIFVKYNLTTEKLLVGSISFDFSFH